MMKILEILQEASRCCIDVSSRHVMESEAAKGEYLFVAWYSVVFVER